MRKFPEKLIGPCWPRPSKHGGGSWVLPTLASPMSRPYSHAEAGLLDWLAANGYHGRWIIWHATAWLGLARRRLLVPGTRIRHYRTPRLPPRDRCPPMPDANLHLDPGRAPIWLALCLGARLLRKVIGTSCRRLPIASARKSAPRLEIPASPSRYRALH